MGQAASYAESSIQRALLRMKTEEQQKEVALLALCGYRRPRCATSETPSSVDDSQDASARGARTTAATQGAGASVSSSPGAAASPSKREEKGVPRKLATSTPNPVDNVPVSPTTPVSQRAVFALAPLSEKQHERQRKLGRPAELPPAPTSWGSFVSLTPDSYSIDELREAVPFLPDALWVSLNRVSLLYVLDGDLDGNFGLNDIAHFTDWAIRVVPPEVSADQLAEVVQAHAALECWNRCLVRGQQLREGNVGVTAAATGNSDSRGGTEPPATRDSRRARRHPHRRDRGGHSSLLVALTASDDLLQMAGGMEELLPADEEEEPLAQHGKQQQKGDGRPSAVAGGSARQGNHHPQLPPLQPLQTPVTRDDKLQASVHFARWMLRMTHAQELARRQNGERQRLRYREARRCSGPGSAASVPTTASTTVAAGIVVAAATATTGGVAAGNAAKVPKEGSASLIRPSPTESRHSHSSTPSNGNGGIGEGSARYPRAESPVAVHTEVNQSSVTTGPEDDDDRALMQSILPQASSTSPSHSLSRNGRWNVHEGSGGGNSANSHHNTNTNAVSLSFTGASSGGPVSSSRSPSRPALVFKPNGGGGGGEHVRPAVVKSHPSAGAATASNGGTGNGGASSNSNSSMARGGVILITRNGGGNGDSARRGGGSSANTSSKQQHQQEGFEQSRNLYQDPRRELEMEISGDEEAAAANPTARISPSPAAAAERAYTAFENDEENATNDSNNNIMTQQLSEREEVLLDALLAQGVAFYDNLHACGWLTVGAVEELYVDLAVHESYGLPFWAFCRKLHEKSAKEVEAALGLTPEEAVRELTSAVALEEARQRVALELVQQQRLLLLATAPAGSANVLLAVGDDKDGDEEEDVPRRGVSRDTPTSQLAPPSPSAELLRPLFSSVEPVPSFIVPRYTLLCFVHCFIKAYWDVLENMGFDPFTAEAVHGVR